MLTIQLVFSTFATSLGHSVYTGTIVQALSWSSRISGRCRGDETSCTTGKGDKLRFVAEMLLYTATVYIVCVLLTHAPENGWWSNSIVL
jgi:hypothetical protein